MGHFKVVHKTPAHKRNPLASPEAAEMVARELGVVKESPLAKRDAGDIPAGTSLVST